MDKEEYDTYQRERELAAYGIDVDANQSFIHSTDETEVHAMLKGLCALKIYRKGRVASIETELPGKGVVDVLDWGEPDGKAVVYEIETAWHPQKAREKAEQYAGGIIRDVITIPAQEAPTDCEAAMDWLEQYIAG